MSSSDNDQKKAEDMSLSELLGDSASAGASADAPTGEPVDDGSGLINLAQMVQAAAQPAAPIEQPRPASPSYPGAPMPGTMPPAAQTGGYPAAPAQPSYDPNAMADFSMPKKKSPLPIIIIAAVVVIAGGVGAFVALSGSSEDDSDAKLAKLEADLAAALAKAEADGDESKKAELEAQIAAQQAGGNPETGAENAPGGEDEEFEITEEEVDDGKGGKTKRRVRRAKKSTKSTASSSSSSASTSSSVGTTKEAAPAASSSSSKPATKTSELDSLLAGSGGSTAASSGGGGLPEKPSRAQVQQAMGKVVSQAKSVCGKSGSGQVSVRIVVGSNGVARDAIPTGAHSADSLGRCVATIARRTTRLPKFKSPTFTFTYPFNI
ncbi:MAG: hypothetical protein JXX29_16605 [Deltaproteobacteria bacterium]|nr:hypothetical protein [Deltaproteobacteria bacterium]MBN2673306.1 hypothetical protein [Deltaproteobacteria bacterium]